jgi:hypothetical protein
LQITPITYIGREDAAEIDHVFKNLDSFIKHSTEEFHLVKEMEQRMEQDVLKIVSKYVSTFKEKQSTG